LPLPSSDLTIEYRLTVDEYLSKRVEFGNFRVVGFARISDTNETFASEQTLELQQPSLDISFDGNLELFEEKDSHINVSFTNPLNVTLTDCRLTLKDELLFELHDEALSDVAAYQKVRLEVPIQPQSSGNSTLIAVVNCEQLYDVHGSVSYFVNAR
jgi:hypothetical protein